MTTELFYPERIFLEQQAADLPLARQILDRCSGVPVELVADVPRCISDYHEHPPADFDSKRALLLCRNQGRFLEPCPGTNLPYRCCRYTILHTGLGCPLDCSYCVLQAYLNSPFITLFVNREDMLAELAASKRLQDGRIVRVGTGEYMDSLALEHLCDLVPAVLPLLHQRPGLILELKTKTAAVDCLLELDHRGSLVVAWSLNAPAISAGEEHGAASLDERIAAAQRVIDAGMRVAFHFDPLIIHPGWQEGYADTIARLAAAIPPAAITWISIGSLRFMPPLKRIAEERFPATRIYTGEFVPGLDGKQRYLQAVREPLYRHVIALLRDRLPGVCLYFCMEHPQVWQHCLGHDPGSNAGVKRLLDQRV